LLKNIGQKSLFAKTFFWINLFY